MKTTLVAKLRHRIEGQKGGKLLYYFETVCAELVSKHIVGEVRILASYT